MQTQILKFKIVIIGEHAVGKTSFIKKFVEGRFTKDYRPTIGTNLFIKRIKFEASHQKYESTLTLYDIAGQEKWQSMRFPYYQGAQAVIIMGDLTRKHTFDQIKKFWIKDVRKYLDDSVPILLLANKEDIRKEKTITTNYLEKLTEDINACKYMITSAKTGKNVTKSFKEIISAIVGDEIIVPRKNLVGLKVA